MSLSSDAGSAAAFMPASKDPDLRSVYEYWNKLRRGRDMPSRGDVDPADIPSLLPHIILYNVEGSGGPYTIRLIGEHIEQFIGQHMTGRPAGSIMDRPAATTMVKMLDAVAEERAPKFRAGRTYWHPDKDYAEFEACFLPLSADGSLVNMILGAMKFTLKR